MEQGRCRRLKAAELWRQGQWAEALRLQLQLVNSGASSGGDQQLLVAWQQQLEARALQLYAQGDLSGALKVLANLHADRNAEGTALGDNLREGWNRNKLQKERAVALIAQQRWWEALDALNRIDHPWWKRHTQTQRQQVTKGIEGLRSAHERQHNSHGGELESNVPADQLDALVNQKIAQGMDDWKAFSSACRDLGGKVVEAGPESACRR
jgi:tetratricopeptide (TPR) repeat protein